MILFICHGNVARSQFAEALMIKKGFTDVYSVGTSVRTEKEGNNLINDGITAFNAAQFFLKITGIDISNKQRKSILVNFVEKASIIISLTHKSNLPEYVFDYKNKLQFWDIDDPHDMDFEGYKIITAKIEQKVNGLIQKLKSSSIN